MAHTLVDQRSNGLLLLHVQLYGLTSHIPITGLQ
jgi:hypothetical protein